MTVQELKEALNEYPDDMLVLVDGYEGGLDHIKISQEEVFDQEVSPWYDGRFKNDYLTAEEEKNLIDVVALRSGNRLDG